MILIKIHNFDRLNYLKKGTSQSVLEEMSSSLLSVAWRPLDQVFRIDNDEFAIIFYGASYKNISKLVDKCKITIKGIYSTIKNKDTEIGEECIKVYIGAASCEDVKNIDQANPASSMAIKEELMKIANENYMI